MIDPASWKLHGPDHDGFVWLEIDKGGGSFEMVNLGTVDEVRERLVEWLLSHDPGVA